MSAVADDRPSRHLLDHVLHATFGIVEPLLDETLDRLDPVALCELDQAGLANSRRADLGEEVAVPLVGHANAAPATRAAARMMSPTSV